MVVKTLKVYLQLLPLKLKWLGQKANCRRQQVRYLPNFILKARLNLKAALEKKQV